MKTTFQALLQRARGQIQLENRQTLQGTEYTKTKGYHIYGHLDLALRLSAAEDDKPAKKYLEILQSFTTVAERTGREFAFDIFEVQGERIHLFLETEDGTESLETVINFARVWNAAVNDVVKPKAGPDFKSFSMAADYGSCLVLPSSGGDVSESLISLGNAANRPAKHLSRWTVERNGHLNVNMAALAPGRETKDPYWKDFDVSTRTEFSRESSDRAILNRVTEGIEPEISGYMAKDLQPVGTAPVHAPIKKQGFSFRADYDGFSRRVETAMSQPDHVQQALVEEFDTIMKQVPKAFAEKIKGTVHTFPWAGDCANLFVEPEIDYETAQTSMPATAAHIWHKNAREYTGVRAPAGGHKWAVGVLGGEDGVTLMARVYTQHRTFAVAAGWAWGRSIDAYQASGMGAEDSVIANEDKAQLDDAYAEPFKELNSLFQKATFEALDRAIGDRAKAKEKPAPAPFYIGGKKEEHPAQRPYSA
jgi:hypothetical protein